MLSRLAISNLAVVEALEVTFASGLNVLTGETGSGKSVLIGALELVLGARAESAVVREGAREARVEAEFEFQAPMPAVVGFLEEVGLPASEEGRLVVRRVVNATGGGRVWINDAATTVATLRRLGRLLVDIHGPRANQNVLEESFQRAALDAFAGGEDAAYAASWAAYGAAREEVLRLRATEVSEGETELLREQIAEFEEAALTAEDETLPARHAAAAHAEEIVAEAQAATEALGGEGGASEILSRLAPRLAALVRHFPAAEAWGEQIATVNEEVQALSRTIAEAAGQLELDPEAFAEMDRRLAVIHRLKRKYLRGVSSTGEVAQLLALLEAKRERLALLMAREESLAAAEARCAKAEKEVRKAGAAWSARRQAFGVRLAQAVTDELKGLGFLQAGFSIALEPCEPEAHGCDRVTYLFAPNPGEPARSLAAIASSGEMARVMLALKTVLSAQDQTDVLVFDELDANIGGEAGRAVGQRLREVARTHQVLAITHLPQSAAYGERHLVVAKEVSKGRTRTQVRVVTGQARVQELARMLGGVEASSVVLRHAEELLEGIPSGKS